MVGSSSQVAAEPSTSLSRGQAMGPRQEPRASDSGALSIPAYILFSALPRSVFRHIQVTFPSDQPFAFMARSVKSAYWNIRFNSHLLLTPDVVVNAIALDTLPMQTKCQRLIFLILALYCAFVAVWIGVLEYRTSWRGGLGHYYKDALLNWTCIVLAEVVAFIAASFCLYAARFLPVVCHFIMMVVQAATLGTLLADIDSIFERNHPALYASALTAVGFVLVNLFVPLSDERHNDPEGMEGRLGVGFTITLSLIVIDGVASVVLPDMVTVVQSLIIVIGVAFIVATSLYDSNYVFRLARRNEVFVAAMYLVLDTTCLVIWNTYMFFCLIATVSFGFLIGTTGSSSCA